MEHLTERPAIVGKTIVPWKMTQREFIEEQKKNYEEAGLKIVKGTRLAKKFESYHKQWHKDWVRTILEEGKSVPDKVLRDYPEIELGVLIDTVVKEGKLLYTGEILGLGKQGDIGVSFKARQALKEMRGLLEEHPELTKQVPKEMKLLLKGEAYEGIFEDLRKSLGIPSEATGREHLT